ncbi:MAG TPA: hypothetical protein VHJ20_13560 [Polyangia bacterium]|nr:hypothetical protein [Polyangia bacterium]
MTKTPTTNLLRVTLLALLAATGCATTSETTTHAPKASDLDLQKTIGGKVAGTIVWTSARAGLPHVYAMKTDGTDVRELTKGDFTDWNPRLSPDGARVLFSRSRDEGFVHESDANTPGTWDLYVVGLDGRGIGKEIEDATWGTWITPDEILYQRGAKILRKKIGADEETTVLDTTTCGFGAGTIVEEPRLSATGHLVALTLVGAHRQVGIWHLKKKSWSIIGSGTGIEWGPNDASVVWVGTKGRGLVALERADVQHGDLVAAKPAAEGEDKSADKGDEDAETPAGDAKAPAHLLDMPGKRSHEAFPRLSSDGKWLVFGAAKGSGEHDAEDYEIYLWEVGTPANTAVRMTFDGGSDRWPDLFVGAGGAGEAPAEEAVKKNEESSGEKAPAEEPAKSEAPKEEAPADAAKPASDDANGDEFTPAPAKPKAKGKKKKR